MVNIEHRYQWNSATGDHTYVFLPKNWKADSTVAPILFCVGFGDSTNTVKDPASAQPFIYQLAESGYPVIVSDIGVGSAGAAQWGNATARDRITKSLTLLYDTTSNGRIKAKTGKVHLAGFSMGGLNIMSWANANPALVKSVAGFSPVSDLSDIYTKSAYTASINAAWGGTYNDSVHGLEANPKKIAQAGGFAGMPMKFWYAFNDTAVPQSTVQSLATSIGSNATAFHAGGYGHSWELPKNSLYGANGYLEFLKQNDS